MKEVDKASSISSTKPFPRISPARTLSPCPNAMAARGEPPAPPIDENAEISMMMEVVTPTPANASVGFPVYDLYIYGRLYCRAN